MGRKCPKCHFKNPDDIVYCGKCGARLPSSEQITIPQTKTLETPTDELRRGTTFAGRYEIIEELGKGGMGKVYRVEDKKINEEVALKLIKHDVASDKKTIERFSNELKLARKIVHKNVGRMYELMEEKGIHFITMEYVPGQDLKGLIRQSRQLALGTTINIAMQLCEGLEEAHRLGVVHRDLKPSNIMVDKEGIVRIMDFGIARSIKGKGITGTGVMIGTPEYMSPEQVEGLEVDQRSDIYSLGIILYEMMTGRVPFEGDTPFSIALKHKSETPKNPIELNSQIPKNFADLVLRCMEKEKEKRYQKIGEIMDGLSKIEKFIPSAERIVPKRKVITPKKIIKTFGLKKSLYLALAITALVISFVIIWQLALQKEAVPTPSDESSILLRVTLNNASIKTYRAIGSKTVARVPSATILAAEKKSGDWYKVFWKGFYGYMHVMNVEVINHPLGIKIIHVNTSIKAKPDFDSKTILYIQPGTVMLSEKKIYEWYRVFVEIDGVRTVGYINESHIEVVN